MHTIKSKARYAAWRQDSVDQNDAVMRFMPFAGRHRTHPETRASQSEEDLRPPRRSDTEPIAPRPTTPQSSLPPHRPQAQGSQVTATGLEGRTTLSVSHTSDTHRRTFPTRVLRLFTRDRASGEEYDNGKTRGKRLRYVQQVRTILLTWINLFIVFIPVGIVCSYSHKVTPAVVFPLNLLAMLPSIAALGSALEELGLYLGETWAMVLVNFNIPQLVSSVLLLRTRQVKVLQISLLGSILANLLFTTGLAFFVGCLSKVKGRRRKEQYFNARLAQKIGMFLLLAVLSLLVPTLSSLLSGVNDADITSQSRGTSIIILLSYMLWLVFQHTNGELFRDPDNPTPKARLGPASRPYEGEALKGIAQIGAASAATLMPHPDTSIVLAGEEEDAEESREPRLSILICVVTTILALALLVLNTQLATDSLQGLLSQTRLTKNFVGLVLLPIVSFDPKAIIMASKDEMDISISLTLDRCMQTALLVNPFVILLAWCMGIDSMTLEFGSFAVACLFASILIVTYVVHGGKSDWLVGVLLVKVYIIIALASFYVKT
ncbi:MAG: hypothetical protein M1828_005856 [Chrysothrix sp. TS-e1954]|nr:MAG: hypothetical protein M1828_005856 [Chrysothrix sp. TS-e1954]